MIKTVVMLSASAMVFAAGCSELKHNQQAEEVKQNWNHMRAKVKLQLAERSFDSGKVDRALEHCNEVIGLDPKLADGYLLMTRIQLEKGQVARAEAALDRAEAITPLETGVAYLRGVIAERRGATADALSFYERAYQANPDEIDYLLTYAETLIAADRCEAALEVLASRRVDFEQDATIHALTGHVLSLMEKDAEAANCFRTALRLAPDDDLLREEAASVFLEAGQFDDAIKALEPLIRSEDDKVSFAASCTYATALLRSGKPVTAVRFLERAVRTNDDEAVLWQMLAEAYMHSGQMEPAGDAIGRAVTLDSKRPEAWLLFAFHALQTGQAKQAILAAQQLVEQNPEDIVARVLLAQAWETDPGQVERAIEQYEEILAIDPHYEWAHLQLDRLTRSAKVERTGQGIE